MKYIFGSYLEICRERICSGFQYVPTFALYPHKTEAKDGRLINIHEVCDLMRGDDLKRKSIAIKQAADRGDIELKNKLKSQMPYITHSGVFLPRCNAGLIMPGFTYQLDVDNGKNSNLDAGKVLKAIIKDRQLNILFASKSPSGKGIKALLFLKELMCSRDSWTPEEYSSIYHKVTDILERYFLEKHGVYIDTQMKAISQPLYLFYSDDLYINGGLRA